MRAERSEEIHERWAGCIERETIAFSSACALLGTTQRAHGNVTPFGEAVTGNEMAITSYPEALPLADATTCAESLSAPP